MLSKLQIGYNGPIQIRYTESISPKLGVRLLYVSDLHFNVHSKNKAQQLIGIIEQTKPDIILWGGDYVDSKSGMEHLRYLLQNVRPIAPSYAIAGNHDYFIGIHKIKAIFTENNSHWIENNTVFCQIGQHRIQIDGNKITKRNHSADIRILCLHHPLHPKKVMSDYHIILAGHLHGCQFVFWEKDHYLYPGCWIYRHNFIQKTDDQCVYLIGRGIGDTLPVRYNCVFEVVVVDI
jgi:uncharacterized protein